MAVCSGILSTGFLRFAVSCCDWYLCHVGSRWPLRRDRCSNSVVLLFFVSCTSSTLSACSTWLRMLTSREAPQVLLEISSPNSNARENVAFNISNRWTSILPPLVPGIPQSSRDSGASGGVPQSGGCFCFRCARPGFCGHPVHVRPPVRPPALQFQVQPRADSSSWDEPQAGGGSRGLLQVLGGRFYGGRAGRGVVGSDQGRRKVHQGTEVRSLAACLPAFPPNKYIVTYSVQQVCFSTK